MAGQRPWMTIVFTGILAVFSGRNVQATPGRVGCFYDLQLCERNELCYNDSLFGTCVSQLSDAVNYNDLEPEALNQAARVLQYLIETGYKWQDSYTQCVVGKYLQSVVGREQYDPEVCEYLKAILDVIDQNRASNSEPSGGLSDQQATGIAAAAPVDGPVSHGEFLSKSDGREDFDALPSGLQQQQPTQINVDDPNAYAALQQYMRTYQQSLLQASQADPSQSADASVVEKKSGSSLEQVTTAQPAVEVSTLSTTTTPTPQLSTEVVSIDVNQTLSPEQNAAEDTEAMQRLFGLVNSYPPSDDQLAQMALVQQSPELTAVPMDQPNITPVFGTRILSDGIGPVQFNDMNGVQFVPDFSAPPPQGMLSPMDQMLLAQQMYGPQGPPMGDPRGPQGFMVDPRGPQSPMMADPRMMQMGDPRMIQMQDPRMMQMGFGQPQQGPSMADQILLAQQMQMMGPPPQLPVMDARALMGPGFGMNPAMMNMQQGPGLMDQMPFVGMPNKRGPPPPQMMNPVDQMIYAQQIQQMLASQYPPQMQNGPPMMSGPFSQGMRDPSMMMLGQQGPQYGFFPQGVPPPFMQQNGPPPFLRDQFGPQDQWAPMPMMLPEGFRVFESQPVDASDNSTGQSSDEMIKQLFAERGEQSGTETGNGSSGPTSQSKKDQEYKSLLPSDENLQAEVVEDVTVKVVKGSMPDGPDDNTGLETDTVVKDSKTAAEEENYVFIMTSPELNFDEAHYLLNWLAAVMSLPPQTFYDISVNDDLVTFRINPAFQNLNATYIAQSLGDDELRRALRQANGLEIVRAGVGKYALEETQGGLSMPEMRFQQTAVVQSEPIAEIAKKYDVVDSTYAFIDVKESQLTYDKARRILNWLAVKLEVPQTVFSNLHIEGNQLVFRVSPYFNKINATSVSLQLADPVIISELKDQFGVTIDKTGIGDEVQVVKADNKQQQILLIGLILVACIAAILIILGIAYLVRRNMLMRMKLHGLGGDVESSKEYEELCRQRMASKNLESLATGIGASPEKTATDRTTHSSTSSWSEEPAPSNMDITTGHMVLSYMEDHLKHKERLNEEWASLCTYEADPKRTEAASQKENLIKNRYPDVLPYDHTRVRLNPQANETKSDYINASFITDADPKNPAYIATQGPLPETVTDFWQMVWENNSTAIVMLTRLRENDQDMCHVYWPKEGSEVYNNFEVHLVSEHIWCDDYLVRNFYLKNLQSHETRTVTQFHYLNWPNLGVPSSLKTFLEFRRKINKCYKGGSSPIAVVCSDGVDRTGAYCLIDLVLNRMAKGAKEIDIAATLEHLRDQRMDMVRTKDQFEFVLTAVAQEIQAILKSMPQK